jgi:hypothetical protein
MQFCVYLPTVLLFDNGVLVCRNKDMAFKVENKKSLLYLESESDENEFLHFIPPFMVF